jgi:hypothetical protein
MAFLRFGSVRKAQAKIDSQNEITLNSIGDADAAPISPPEANHSPDFDNGMTPERPFNLFDLFRYTW